jgi:hypothetical protein
MLQIHPCARATPAVRAEIARSREPAGVLARRYGVSTETIHKWRKRGPEDCLDHSARPRTLPWRATEEERAIVCEVRRATRFALDDLTFALRHFLPHLNRHSIWRILRAEGLHRLSDLPPLYPGQRPKKGRASSATTILASSTSTSNSCPSCTSAAASSAGATSTSPSSQEASEAVPPIAARARSTWP